MVPRNNFSKNNEHIRRNFNDVHGRRHVLNLRCAEVSGRLTAPQKPKPKEHHRDGTLDNAVNPNHTHAGVRAWRLEVPKHMLRP